MKDFHDEFYLQREQRMVGMLLCASEQSLSNHVELEPL